MSQMESHSTPSPAADTAATGDSYVPSMLALQGRIGRLRYLAYSSVVFVIGFAYAAYCIYHALSVTTSGAEDGAAGQAILFSLGVPFFLAHTGAHLVFAFRRFQDTGNSGWLALLALIPVVGCFVGLYLLFCPGNTGRNQYGPAPAANTSGIVLASIGLPLFIVVTMIVFVMFILATFVAGVR